MKISIPLLFFIVQIFAQTSFTQVCPGSLNEYYLNSNNINASFLPRGNKFNSGTKGEFLVPYPSDKSLSTIFASSLWIGGFDDAGNFKYAAEAYPSTDPQQSDYSVGPLTPIGTLYDSVCTHFDKAWTVYGDDIRAHMDDYYADFQVDDPIASIFLWPAKGNHHFEEHYGFELPFDNFGLAPFRDANSNNRYDPENGDYPIVFPNHSEVYIPDQIMWMVFNDLGIDDEEPLRFEIQLTAFAFHCQENTWLNNTIFNKYRILNRAVTSIDSVFLGMWTDYDLGCHADDFIGSDSMRNTEFVYNDENGDGDAGVDCNGDVDTYGNNPPVQSMTYLSPSMHSFIFAGNNTEPIHFYRKLNGRWNDNTPIYPEGTGYNPASVLQPTQFLFNGDPLSDSSWSARNVLDAGANTRTVSSVKVGRMNPGAIKEIVLAYQYHHHPDSNYKGQLSLMYNNIDSLLNMNYPGEDCTPFPYCYDGDCVWPGDFNHDGIANHYDLLHWGVMNTSSGDVRNGLVSWRGYYAPDWVNQTPGGINYKHGDANSDGLVNRADLSYNIKYFQSRSPEYVAEIKYPQGPEIIISSDPIDAEGRIKNLKVSTNNPLSNILGLAFELEFDTTIFKNNNLTHTWPSDSSLMYLINYNEPPGIFYQHMEYAAVNTDNQAIYLPENTTLLRSSGSTSLVLKSGLTLEDIPDTVFIRLRNLIAIDAEGNDLNIGANTLTLLKSEITSNKDPQENTISFYPNPATDFLYVTGSDNFEIINARGQAILKVDANSNSIDISQTPAGIYFVRNIISGKISKLVIFRKH